MTVEYKGEKFTARTPDRTLIAADNELDYVIEQASTYTTHSNTLVAESTVEIYDEAVKVIRIIHEGQKFVPEIEKRQAFTDGVYGGLKVAAAEADKAVQSVEFIAGTEVAFEDSTTTVAILLLERVADMIRSKGLNSVRRWIEQNGQ